MAAPSDLNLHTPFEAILLQFKKLSQAMKKWFGIIIIIALFLMNGLTYAIMEGEEYQVKAAFIYNFLKFVEWPSEAPISSSPAITLCIIGNDPFGKNINAFSEKIVGSKRIAVRHTNSIKEIKDCHALFITESEKSNLSEIIEFIAGSYILTIGDTDGFAQKDVIINMYIEDKKVRFEVNLDAAKRTGLRIDSRLLKLARIVGQ